MATPTNCRSCGADIIWLKTAYGRNIPVDIPFLDTGDVENKSIETAIKFDKGYMHAHFETCPHADKWRKKA